MEKIEPDESRPYDLIVWGASGFTGRLVVEYLASNYVPGGELRWAIAGRDRYKLDQVLAGLDIEPEAVTVLLADSSDEASLAVLARQARVVLSTVGPYARYGDALVQSCVEQRTDYCDLAGETQWIRRMIDRHAAHASNSGARIVHSCGFDSIPSDMGVWFLQQEAKTRFGEYCNRIQLLVKAMKGGGSGGTYASMLNALEEGRADRNVRWVLADPYGLNPDGQRSGPDSADQRGIEFNTDLGVWTAPFVMSVINTRIVRRSNALLDYRYGRDFRYAESLIAGRGAFGWARAAAITAGLRGFMAASSSGITRDLIVKHLIPAPGEGPDRNDRENGFFNMVLVGHTADGRELRVHVTGDRDPGYGSTSKMLAESAVCLACDEIPVSGGFWTPSTALGPLLFTRLTKRAGLDFRIHEPH